MTRAKIAHLTLGCDKNRVDTERTLGSLARAGFVLVPSPEPAFALVINTCGFIGPAKEEGVETILDAVRTKDLGDYELVVVIGCLVERHRAELAVEVPEVDIWMGLEHVDQLAPILAEEWIRRHGDSAMAAGAGSGLICPGASLTCPGASLTCLDPFPRFITTPPHYSFLKIADGCNSGCRYCAIPRIRGPLRSSSFADLIAEARALEQAGVKELNLVAQDTTAWGHDLSPSRELADLIEGLLDQTAIPWIRVLYSHPNHVTDRLIDLLAHEDRLLHYLDLPLQHISDRILHAMGRQPGRAGTMALVERLKTAGIFLRSTFLIGHPGETYEDFEEVLSFLEDARLLWASAFAFSPEEGTVAAGLPDRPDPEEVEERMEMFFETQRLISEEELEKFRGRELTVLVDEPWAPLLDDDEDWDEEIDGPRPDPSFPVGPVTEWSGRLTCMAVEVDGVVRLIGHSRPGEFSRALVVDSWDYDLKAIKIGEAK